jgi:hypothetical protein
MLDRSPFLIGIICLIKMFRLSKLILWPAFNWMLDRSERALQAEAEEEEWRHSRIGTLRKTQPG